MDSSAQIQQGTQGALPGLGGTPLGKYGKFPATKGKKAKNGADRRRDFAHALREKVKAEADDDAYAVLADSDRFGADENSTLLRFAMQSQARVWAPAGRHPLKRCHRWLIPAVARQRMADSGIHMTGGVEIWHQRKGESAHYRGLETCKSVWACPVCSARLMERRTLELQDIVSRHTAAGGQLIHVTFTVPHARFDNAKDLVKCLSASYNALGEGRAVKAWRKEYTVGDVRAMEVTWGEANGFHPHYHVLYFVRPGVQVFEDAQLFGDDSAISLADLRQFFHRHWSGAALRSGLGEPSEEHGVRITVAKSQEQLLAEYISKYHRDPKGALWGAEAEMVKAHAKVGDVQRYHPFDFLRAGMLRDRRHPWRILWNQYTEAFRGQQQLRGMKKLADHYGVTTVSDDELFDQAPSDADFALLTVLSPDEWRLILDCGARGLLIHRAKKGGFQGVCEVLDLCASVHTEARKAAAAYTAASHKARLLRKGYVEQDGVMRMPVAQDSTAPGPCPSRGLSADPGIPAPAAPPSR
ncbi:Replication protein [compost metagenome]